MSFNDALKSIRQEKGLSIREVARRSDISHPYLSQLENGKRVAKPEILRKLAKGLNIPFLELMVIAGHLTESDLSELISYRKNKQKGRMK